MQIYILRNGEQHGPYSIEDLRNYIAQGSVSPTDLAWYDGLDGWIAISEIVGEPKAKMPPPPPSAISNPSVAAAPHKQGFPSIYIMIGLVVLFGLYFLSNHTSNSASSTSTKSNGTDSSSAPAPAKPEGASLFAKEMFRTLDDTQSLSIISGTEIEFRHDGQIVLGRYERQADTLRVIIPNNGTEQVTYYSKVEQGWQAQNGPLLLSQEAYDSAQRQAKLMGEISDPEAKFNRGDFDAALAGFNQALNNNPNNELAYFGRGDVNRQKGNYDAAIADYTQGLQINPKKAVAYAFRGLARQLKGDLNGALSDDNQALQLDPKDMRAYAFRGDVKRMQGDLDGAILDYTQALQIDPKWVQAYVLRGVTRQLKGDLDGALSDEDKALQLDPKCESAYDFRGGLRYLKSDLDGAMSDYNHLIEIAPKSIHAYTGRSSIKLQKGDYDGAITDNDQALQIDPSNADAYFSRAIDKQAMGDASGAVSDYNELIELKVGGEPTAYAHLYSWLMLALENKKTDADKLLSDWLDQSRKATASESLKWTLQIATFLLDHASEADLLAEAVAPDQTKDQGHHCEAWYFIGMKRLIAGDKAAAMDDFRKCLATERKDYNEYVFAQAELSHTANQNSATTTGVSPNLKPKSAAVVNVAPDTQAFGVGDIQITFMDGHTEIATTRQKCNRPEVSNKGYVGWAVWDDQTTDAYAHSTETLRIRFEDGTTKDFKPTDRFIGDWGFVDDDSAVVIKSMGHHGPYSFIKFDITTGQELGRQDGYRPYAGMPAWAQPFSDEKPRFTPASSGNNVAPTVPTATRPTTYTVSPGDSLFSIARKFNCTIDQLKAVNSLPPGMLSIGQVLQIPSATTDANAPEP